MSLGLRPTRVCVAITLVGLLATGASKAQEQLPVTGTYKEPLSGLVFPVTIGDWARHQVLQYPTDGGRSVSYETKGATATVYVYPVSGRYVHLHDHYIAEMVQLVSPVLSAHVVREDNRPVWKNGKALERRMATIAFPKGRSGAGSPTIEFLLLSRLESYWLKWRISMRAGTPDDVTTQVADLTHRFIPVR